MNLPIFADHRRVGVIETEAGGPRIRYEQDWRDSAEAFPISLTMPLSAPEWGADVAMPWLMNLLPEGEPLRAMTRVLGVAGDDIIGLISETGRDLAGALTIGQPRSNEREDFVPVGSAGQLERIIEELPAKPFLVGEKGVSTSLAGAQEKLPLAIVNGALAIPVNGAPSTHIVKPDNPRLFGSVQNEALCMVLARRCGLHAAEVTTGVAGKRSYLLVSRYDRAERAGRVRRLHQEDFCQALGRPPGAKYEDNRTGMRGPSLGEMFGLVRAQMTARDIMRLLDAVIFNIAIGNVDSHAKNYSILLFPDRSEFAPLYDLTSGLAWPRITQNHAQDVGGQRRGRHVYGRHWRRMAEAAGLAGPATVRRVGRSPRRRNDPEALANDDLLLIYSTFVTTRLDRVVHGTALGRGSPMPSVARQIRRSSRRMTAPFLPAPTIALFLIIAINSRLHLFAACAIFRLDERLFVALSAST